MKKTLKIIGLTLLIFPGIIAIYLGSAWLFSRITVNSDYKQAENGIEIFVKSNGVHTDLVVPVVNDLKDWRKTIDVKSFKEPGTDFKYVSFGWGDKGFYIGTPTWAELKPSTAFKALFWLSTSAMHVTYYKEAPALDEHTRKLSLTAEQYKTLTEHIAKSFQADTEEHYYLIDCIHYKDINDNFYEAGRTYSFLYTCNNWTNEGLKKAGVKTALWAPFEWGIMRHLD